MPSVEEEERAAMAGGPASDRKPTAGRRAPLSGREEEYLDAEREQDAERLAARRHAEVMDALRKLYGKVLEVEKRLVAIERRPAAAAGAPAGPAPAAGDLDLEAVAPDRDLDGAKGDPSIRFALKAKWWTGEESYVGYRFSETSPDFLDAMAKYLAACAHMAAKDPDENKRKNAKWKALDAARARGWARRLRAQGWKPPPAGAAPEGGTVGDAPADEVML